jgi:hypothetical protein
MPYNSRPRHYALFLGQLGRGRSKPMKHAVRTSILMLGLVGTYVAVAVPQVPAPDGGPILTCPPQQQLDSKCSTQGNGLPPMAK